MGLGWLTWGTRGDGRATVGDAARQQDPAQLVAAATPCPNQEQPRAGEPRLRSGLEGALVTRYSWQSTFRACRLKGRGRRPACFAAHRARCRTGVFARGKLNTEFVEAVAWADPRHEQR